MLPENLELEIVTPEKHLLAETVDYVELPGKEGYLGVLPGHAPLLSELGSGTLSYRKRNDVRYFVVLGGFVEVLPGRVIVLADASERAGEIDVERARRALEKARNELAKASASEEERAAASRALHRAQARIDAANKTGAVPAGASHP
jgi:F-type H+-transporting ATPase subunit epsilon